MIQGRGLIMILIYISPSMWLPVVVVFLTGRVASHRKEKAMSANNKNPIPSASVSPFPALVISVPNPSVESPARKGTAVRERHAILLTLDGATVSTYYKACKEAGVPCTANNPRNAHDKGLIILTAPKS